ncbi:MAG: hypothetical protein VX910_06460 [Candidatus Latescibacterota bacterium]|nr:hypothetical protein [Candidatus Latescibacterota bacterium]
MLNDQDSKKLRDYLVSIMPTREMVDSYVNPNEHGEASCIPELGWVPRGHRKSRDGVDNTYAFYSYEKDRGRRIVNFTKRPSRIHTYGDSFTHCDQVSDGETWQEYLAAHLQEPIRNFGIGGNSVYQALTRMRIVEPGDAAEYLILNAWDDDHYRNIDAWRAARMGRVPRWTLPHLKVSVEAETFEEIPNPCPTLEDHYKMCDPDWVWERFKDDPTIRVCSLRKAGIAVTEDLIAWVADGFGFSSDAFSSLAPSARIEKMHREAALFATRSVIEMAEQFAYEQQRKLMVLLSYGSNSVRQALLDQPLFDQTLLDWLVGRDTPVIDLRDAFQQDFARSSLDADVYLTQFYNGHHTPRGNYFFAWAIKDRLVEWLEPRPISYTSCSQSREDP